MTMENHASPCRNERLSEATENLHHRKRASVARRSIFEVPPLKFAPNSMPDQRSGTLSLRPGHFLVVTFRPHLNVSRRLSTVSQCPPLRQCFCQHLTTESLKSIDLSLANTCVIRHYRVSGDVQLLFRVLNGPDAYGAYNFASEG